MEDESAVSGSAVSPVELTRSGGKRGPLQHGLERFRQIIQMAFQRGRKCIHPLRGRDEIFQRPCGRDVINPKWNDVNALVNSPLYFAFDLWRSMRAPRKDQDHNTTGFDCIDNRFAPIGARNDITRRYPAGHRVCFETGHDRLGDSFVFYRVTYEDIMSHVVASVPSFAVYDGARGGCQFKTNRRIDLASPVRKPHYRWQ